MKKQYKEYDEDELIGNRKRTNKKRMKKAENASQNTIKMDFSVREKPQNQYYINVSNRYGAAKIMTVVLFALFLFVILVFFRDSITYANLMYLARDLDKDVSSEFTSFAEITYDDYNAKEVKLFKNRMAVVGNTGLTLFDPNGSKEKEYRFDYNKPEAVIGNKYSLIYDLGDKDYKVFTSVANVFSADADFPIWDATISENGNYALLTGEEESKYLVTVYNSSFKALTKYYKDCYTVDVSLDPKGEKICILSVDGSNTGEKCEVMICNVGEEKSFTKEYEGYMPIAAEYSPDGTLFVLTDRGLIIFDGTNEVSKYDFGGYTVGSFDINGGSCIVSLSENAIGSENTVLCFDKDGNILQTEHISRKVDYVGTDGKYYAYAVGDGSCSRIDLSDGGVDTEKSAIVPIGILTPQGCLVVCGEGGTESHFVK